MKANELMIGDWVCIEGPNCYQIDEIRKEFGEYRLYLKGTAVFATESEIEPIPLTPEILEKNGFFAQDQGGGRKDMWIGFGPDCEGDVEIEFDCGIATHLKIDGAFKGEYYTSTNIKSVHELQHALRLCGIDKEIVL